ncbi:MAG: DNA mismatch repair protein MutS [Oscillospiraceae bacterium]|jgi:DNA mismatch repair ATPase MutS|nr:DNA mismatch repair protein MutS [Oscillospiraceae bacterium]
MIEADATLRQRTGLQYVLDLLHPVTPYGAERVRRLRFYAPGERAALEDAFHNVAEAMRALADMPDLCARLERLLMPLRDIRGTLRRLGETILTEVELFEVKRFLLQLGQIAPLWAQVGEGFRGLAITDESAALSLLDPDNRRAAGFAVHSTELYIIVEEKRIIEAELRAADAENRPALLARRAELCAREERANLAERARLTEALRPFAAALFSNITTLGALDFTLQQAKLARARGGVRPRITENTLSFAEMDYPPVADALLERGRAFTRLSIDAPEGVAVITGANMGGKSVVLRALALQLLLCHAGFFALAESAALPLLDGVWLSGEDLADAAGGLSTFGAEVVALQRHIAAIDAGGRYFWALDEPARGTNPQEGAALVGALVRRLAQTHSFVVVATHFDGAAQDANAHYQAAGLRPLPETLPDTDRQALLAAHMAYGLHPVPRDAKPPHDALTVCRLLGLDAAVVQDMAERL